MNGPAPTDAAPLLARILGEVPRRYRLGELPAPFAAESDPHGANQLAILIEHARLALAAGQPPDPAIKERFLHCLEALIRDAMQPEGGDPTYQAMVLRNHSGPVQEYVALAVQQAQDSRRVQSLLNAFAHPAKLERLPAGALRDRLAILQGHVGAARWAQAATLLQQQAPEAEAGGDAAVKAGLHRLQHDPALPRLLRLEALQADAEVRRYQSLWERQGPPANSHAAAQEGAAGRLRGNNVESMTKDSLQALADSLNTVAAGQPYRVVTAMYVPAALAAHQEGGKTEWDAVLLRQVSDEPLWDICLLVEAKASPDSVSTDFPRLLRGLKVLSQADPARHYAFKAREGIFDLRGVSLQSLPTEADAVGRCVLYSSDAPAERHPRLLSAAARMQLLSSPECLGFAMALAEGWPADARSLEVLWEQLVGAPQWQALLGQYEVIRRARELMVHVDDLMATARACGE